MSLGRFENLAGSLQPVGAFADSKVRHVVLYVFLFGTQRALTVTLLSGIDGRPAIVDAARQLALSHSACAGLCKGRKLELSSFFAEKDRSLPEPDLILVTGSSSLGASCLPWHLRLSESW